MKNMSKRMSISGQTALYPRVTLHIADLPVTEDGQPHFIISINKGQSDQCHTLHFGRKLGGEGEIKSRNAKMTDI
jgi:hypothetical protein